MIEPWQQHDPQIDPSAWVHSSAVIIGEVRLGPRVSVWPGVVLRGDQGSITVGAESNLQDGVIAHATGGSSHTWVGERVTVGHRALLHGCRVESDCLVGMGAILLDNCVIESGCIIGAGALVPVGRRIPARSLVLGTPGRVIRRVTDAELLDVIAHGRDEYLALIDSYEATNG